jgi:hypothetical protein
MQLDSQFCRMNCQIFSWPSSSGARGGSGSSEMLLGILSGFGAMPSGFIEEDDRVCTRGHLGCDLVEMELHGLAIAGRQHKRGAGAVPEALLVRADKVIE